MADVETKNLPSSLGAIGLVVGFMAGQLTLDHHLRSTETPNRSRPFIDYALVPSTYGEQWDIFARAHHTTLSDHAAEIQSFYQDLLSKQEGLGDDLEKILSANLWELYAR